MRSVAIVATTAVAGGAWLRSARPFAGDVAIPDQLFWWMAGAAAVIWGAVDRLRELPSAGMQWFIAALIAGPFAGALGVIGAALLVDQTGQEALWVALTGGAAFTALLVLAPAGLGMLLGGFLAQKDSARG